MKAEHRKELHTNALAAQLNRAVEGIKHKPNNTMILIAVAAILVLGLVIGWRYIGSRSTASRSALWSKLDSASSMSDLSNLASKNPGTEPARIARFQIARVQLQQGLVNLASPFKRTEAIESLKKAGDEYVRLADESKDRKDTPLLAQEALIGAAQAKESLGDLDGAQRYYERLANEFAKSELGKEALARAEKLKQQRTQVDKFYKTLDQDLTVKE